MKKISSIVSASSMGLIVGFLLPALFLPEKRESANSTMGFRLEDSKIPRQAASSVQLPIYSILSEIEARIDSRTDIDESLETLREQYGDTAFKIVRAAAVADLFIVDKSAALNYVNKQGVEQDEILSIATLIKEISNAKYVSFCAALGVDSRHAGLLSGNELIEALRKKRSSEVWERLVNPETAFSELLRYSQEHSDPAILESAISEITLENGFDKAFEFLVLKNEACTQEILEAFFAVSMASESPRDTAKRIDLLGIRGSNDRLVRKVAHGMLFRSPRTAINLVINRSKGGVDRHLLGRELLLKLSAVDPWAAASVELHFLREKGQRFLDGATMAGRLASLNPSRAWKWSRSRGISDGGLVSRVIGERWAASNPQEALEHARRMQPGVERRHFVQGIGEHIDSSDIQDLPSIDQEPASIGAVRRLARNSLEEAVAFLNGIHETALRTTASNSLAKELIAIDPRKSLDFMVANAIENHGVFELAMFRYSQLDPWGASSWLTSQNHLPDEIKDLGVIALSSNAQFVDPEASMEWIATIEDDRLRNGAQSRVLYNWVLQDESKALQYFNSIAPSLRREDFSNFKSFVDRAISINEGH